MCRPTDLFTNQSNIMRSYNTQLKLESWVGTILRTMTSGLQPPPTTAARVHVASTSVVTVPAPPFLWIAQEHMAARQSCKTTYGCHPMIAVAAPHPPGERRHIKVSKFCLHDSADPTLYFSCRGRWQWSTKVTSGVSLLTPAHCTPTQDVHDDQLSTLTLHFSHILLTKTWTKEHIFFHYLCLQCVCFQPAAFLSCPLELHYRVGPYTYSMAWIYNCPKQKTTRLLTQNSSYSNTMMIWD